MKGRVLAAIMGCTALTPAPAQAAPLVAFVQGATLFFGAGGIGSVVASTVGGAFGAGFAAAQFLSTSAIGRILVAVGLNYAISRLTKVPQPRPQDQWANFAQPISYAVTILGQVRAGGPLGFTGFASGADVVTGQTGAKRHYSPVLAMHRSHAIAEHYLADRPVEVQSNGNVITAPFNGNHYRIRSFLGTSTQSADAELMDKFPEITSAHNFRGLTGAHIWCRRPSEENISTKLEGGRQATWSAVVRGVLAYDPRSGATVWTRNAALLTAHWLVEVRGKTVDWDEVAEEADVCDELITTRGGAIRRRWTLDIALSDDQDYEDQRAAIAAAADIWFYERPDGDVGFKVGRWVAPDITLTDQDFYAVEKTTGQSGASAINRLAVKYTEPANQWKETATADIVFSDGDELRREDPAVYGIAEHNQAFRIARRMMAVRRPPSVWRGTVGIIGYWLTQRRFWRIEHTALGSVYVELQRMERHADGMAFDFEAVEVDPDDFNPEVSGIEPERTVYQVVASTDTVPDLAGLAVTNPSSGRLRYTWTMPDDESLTQRIRYRVSGSEDWLTVDVPAGQTFLDITGLAAGTYEAQAVNRTSARRLSTNWQPVTPLVITI